MRACADNKKTEHAGTVLEVFCRDRGRVATVTVDWRSEPGEAQELNHLAIGFTDRENYPRNLPRLTVLGGAHYSFLRSPIISFSNM